MVSVLLAGVLAASVVGCGSATESSKVDSSTVSQTEEETLTATEETTTKVDVKLGEFDKKATIEETVLVDQNDVKVTATKLEFTNYSAELSISIENNSSKDITFIAGSLGYSCNSVNGYMVSDGYINEDVAAGKKTNEKVSFSLTELQAYGIHSIADIELGIYTTDADHNHTFYEPRKILTTVTDSYDYETDIYKKVMEDGILESLVNCKINYWNADQIYRQENVSIESVALVTNKDGEQLFFIEFANGSNQMVNVSISSVAINGLVLYGGDWSSSTVNPGTKAISDIQVNNLLDEEDQDLIKVGDVSALSFELVLQNSDYEDITTVETVTINLSKNPSSYEVSGTPVFDSNGIKLTEIGVVEDKESYSSYAYHIFYAVENETTDSVSAGCGYNSLSVNGYMMDFYDFNGSTPTGMTGLLRIDLDKDDIDSAGITSAEDIKEVEFVFEVTDEKDIKIVEETIRIRN